MLNWIAPFVLLSCLASKILLIFASSFKACLSSFLVCKSLILYNGLDFNAFVFVVHLAGLSFNVSPADVCNNKVLLICVMDIQSFFPYL